jgi:hypothetical protein
MPRPILALAPLAAALVGLVQPAAADWLVTRQGARIETRGPWAEKGRLIVFTTADGKLSSLRTDEIDLEASRRATQEAAAPAPAPAPAPRKATIVLTDADVEHVSEPEATTATPTAGAKPEGPAAPTPGGELAVANWEQKPAGDGLEILGTLNNGSDSTATAIRLTVIAFDEDGRQAARGVATLGNDALPAGQSTTFRVEFPELRELVSVRFEPKATLFKVNQTGTQPPAASSPPPD